MKILVIFIAAAVAASASRPSRSFESEYRDFFESPPPPPPSSSRPSFLSSYSRPESFFRHPQSFSDDTTIFSSGPPTSFREGRIFFDSPPPPSSYFSSRRPHTFYHSGPSSFREGKTIGEEYRGPPPPAPIENPRMQTAPGRDERPGGNSPELQTTKAYGEHRSQQPTMTTTTGHRQPLSFGGHSNHLSYGNHGLGFASVAGVTSSDINPLAVAGITSTTRTAAAAAGGGSTISMHSPSPSQVQVSQQQLATNPPNSGSSSSSSSSGGMPTSAGPTLKVAVGGGGQQISSPSNTASTLNDLESTIPPTTKTMSVTPKPNLQDGRENALSQAPGASIMFHEPHTMSHEFRTVTQDFPPAAHGQLPIEAPKQQQHHHLSMSDMKENLIFYETKENFPFLQSGNQIYQQQQQHQLQNNNNNNNNFEPVRFSIPTGAITATLIAPNGAVAAAAPMKLAFQGSSSTDFLRSPVPNTNAYTFGQPIDLSQFGKLNTAINAVSSGMPIYYIVQNNEQAKPVSLLQQQQTNQISSSGVPLGLQLQLGGFGGIEYLASSGNSEATMPVVLRIGKVPLNPQEQSRSPEPMYTKIGFGQSPW